MTWKGSKLLKNVLQLICLWLAWFTAMSRVSDYKHHWSDVLAGLLLGIIAALIMVNSAIFYSFTYIYQEVKKMHQLEILVMISNEKNSFNLLSEGNLF